MLTQPVTNGARQLGTFHVAQSLAPGRNGPGQPSQHVRRGRSDRAGRAARRGDLDRDAGRAAARPDGRVRRRRRSRRSRPPPRRRRGPVGGSEPEDVAQPHARPAAGRFDREREFVADASHELRTPITVAQGELELLRRDADPAERERLDVIRRELRRMEGLIGEMLTLAREDAGRSLEPRRVPVDDLLDDLRRDLPLLGPRDYEVGRLDGTMDADPDRVAQVLRNLARNAVAHTAPRGTVEIRATADGDRVRFEVIGRRTRDRSRRGGAPVRALLPIARGEGGIATGPGSASRSHGRSSRRTGAGSGRIRTTERRPARDRATRLPPGRGNGPPVTSVTATPEHQPVPGSPVRRCRAEDDGERALIGGQRFEQRLVVQPLERDVRHRDHAHGADRATGA